MKVSKIVKFTMVSLLALGLVAYVGYAILFLSGPDKEELCSAVELIVKEDEQSLFVGKEDIENMLKNAPQRNGDAYIVPETF